MPRSIIVIFIVLAVIVLIAQIGGCVECERAGGVYAKTIYGTYECLKR